MSLENLLTALEADAAAETRRLRDEADAAAAGIVEAAREEARTLELDAARSAEAELAREVERRRSEARLAAAADLRDAYDRSAAALEEALRARLAELRETDAYPGLLRALLAEGLAALPEASVLRVDPRDRELAQGIARELGARLEPGPELDTLGGVELADEHGTTARNTLEERLRNAEPELRLLAAELLGAAPAPRGHAEEAVA